MLAKERPRQGYREADESRYWVNCHHLIAGSGRFFEAQKDPRHCLISLGLVERFAQAGRFVRFD